MSSPSAPTPSGSTSGSDGFVHLHVHTEYSMLDGAARIDDLFTRAAEMGMPALATTDHGYVFGAYEFWKKAQGTGVKPIIGVEAYVTPGTHRTDRTRVRWGDERTAPGDDVSGSGAYTHMTLLAKDNTGLHNLFRMDSLASLDQVYAKWPRVDRELLSQLAKGLVNDVADAFDVKHKDNTSLLGMVKGLGDVFETRSSAGGADPIAQVRDNVPAADKTKIEGNLVWQALKRKGAAGWFLAGEDTLLEAMMSLTGSVIVGPPEDAPDGLFLELVRDNC